MWNGNCCDIHNSCRSFFDWQKPFAVRLNIKATLLGTQNLIT